MSTQKKINYGVFGLGISGIATITFLAKQHESFIAWDDSETNVKKAKEQSSDHSVFCDLSDSKWQNIDIMILSPGIPLHFPEPHQAVKFAKKHKIEIICDIELFYRHFPNNTYIGITGTNGKSTTTSLIGHILKENNISCHVVGNIGTPILSIIPKKDDVIVIEISSFQLDLVKKIRFNAAILLNITKDHLDRHGSMENYTESKYKIFSNQKNVDFAIINNALNDKYKFKGKVIKLDTTKKTPNGVSISENILYRDGNKVSKIDQPKSLLGSHNQENIIAAYAAVSNITNLSDKKILDSIETFQGLHHRIQILGEKHGFQFINDSKATNFESTEKALEIFDNIYWIAGGVSKEGGIDPIFHFKKKITHAFLIGKSSEEFAETLAKYSIPYTKSSFLEQAFYDAVALGKNDKKKKNLLLSPAAASLDQWKNFEERGNYFINLATKYINESH